MKDFSCKGSLAEGEAHYFTGVIYQSSDRVVNINCEEKLPTLKNRRVGRRAQQIEQAA
jgi:hypothetical protein